MTQTSGIKFGSAKIQAILEAGEKQLSADDFKELTELLFDLEAYGLTPWINRKLAELVVKIQWELPEELPEEWSEALQACDYAFLGTELKHMCYEVGVSPVGHKKLLCARLYKRKVPEVLAVMEPHLKEMTPERIKEEIERYAKVNLLPQTEHLYVSKLRDIKDRLEKIYRKDPDEFYRRRKLFEQAIKEREKGKVETLPDLTLEDLRGLLKFTGRLYG